MNKRNITIGVIICLFLIVAFGIVYIFSELYTESEHPDNAITDGQIFKNQYEVLNDKDTTDDHKIRALSIPEDNPFKVSTAEEIVRKIDNKETFIVYFGFASCPWCRSVINPLIDQAKESNVSSIYYVDILNIRDTYELNDKHEAVQVFKGTDAYNDLLDRLNDILDVYTPLTYTTSKGKKKTVKIAEKRIYAPSVILIKNGVALLMEDGISDEQKDAYEEITDKMYAASKAKFKCLFDALNVETYSCPCDDQKC